MAGQQNTDRIQTTHIGSLPRPHDLLDLMKAKYAGEPCDQERFDAMLAAAVAECVRRQVACGIDIVSDGEFSKPGFFTYVQERFEGFERRPELKANLFRKEVAAFPEYYAEYFKQAMMGGAIVSLAPVVCVGPVKYRGEALVKALLAYKRGEPRVCAMLRIPTPEEEDRRRLVRERKALTHERIRHEPH